MAAQLLLGKGFKEVYNLKGGIKAWNGHKAAGPREFHLTFITKDEKPQQMLMLAYHLEEALRVFYLELLERTEDHELVGLLKDLAAFEEQHKNRVMQTCQDLGITASDTEHIQEDIIEGGFDKKTFLRDNAPYLTSPSGVLTVAMMLETQSLDLYLRLAEEVSDNTARTFLFAIADEEKNHLAVLGQLLEKRSE